MRHSDGEVCVHFQTEQLGFFYELLCKFSFEPRIVLFKEWKKTDMGSCEESWEVEDCWNSNWKKNILNIIPIEVWHRIA